MLDLIFWPLGLVPWALVRFLGPWEGSAAERLLASFGQSDLEDLVA